LKIVFGQIEKKEYPSNWTRSSWWAEILYGSNWNPSNMGQASGLRTYRIFL